MSTTNSPYGITVDADRTSVQLTYAVYGGPFSGFTVQFIVLPRGFSQPPPYDPNKPVLAAPNRTTVLPPPGTVADRLPAEGCCLTDWTNEPELAGTWTNDGCPDAT